LEKFKKLAGSDWSTFTNIQSWAGVETTPLFHQHIDPHIHLRKRDRNLQCQLLSKMCLPLMIREIYNLLMSFQRQNKVYISEIPGEQNSLKEKLRDLHTTCAFSFDHMLSYLTFVLTFLELFLILVQQQIVRERYVWNRTNYRVVHWIAQTLVKMYFL
jgi:hypothetical protein